MPAGEQEIAVAMSYRFLALTSMLLLAPAVQAKDKKPVDPNKKICRSETPTGSMMPKSTCHTAAEWARLDADNATYSRDALDSASRNGLGSAGR